jgi:hypothetical protein
MIPKKPAPDVIGGGNRFSDKIMRKQNVRESIDSAERIKRYAALPAQEPARSNPMFWTAAIYDGLRATDRRSRMT